MSITYGEHQKNAMAFQQAQPYSICAMQTGTGKSATTMGSELVNLHENKLDKCIFVCTKGSLGEVLNDYNKFFNYTPMQLNSQESLHDFFDSTKAKVAVTRYEWLKHFEGFLEMNLHGKRLGMWWDEAQRLKNGSRDAKQATGTKTHMYGKMLRPYCSAYHLVTATPIMTKLDDMWSLMHLADPTALGSFQNFTNQFYEQELVPHPRESRRKMLCKHCGCRLYYYNGWDYCSNPACRAIQTPAGFLPFRRKVRSIWNLVEYKNLDELSKIMQKYMFCYFPEQDIEYHLHEFDLSDDTEKEYVKIAKDLIMKEDAGIPTPFATRLIELQYLVNWSYEKRLELWKLANQIKQKGFVLYMTYYESLDAIKSVLDKVEGLEYRTYAGKDSDDDRDENKKWFQQDPANKCLIISQAGGASLNLQVTNEFVFYDIPPGFGAMSQAMGRVIRLFSSFKHFNIHFVLGRHCVDTYKYNCFLSYQEIIQKLMNNKLINLDKPINFNGQMKAEMRKDLCWRQ